MTNNRQRKTIPLHVYANLFRSDDPLMALRGLKKYLNSSFQRQELIPELIWSDGISRACYYAPKCEPQTHLFLVPSIINGPEIFDILPEQSFIRFLNERGVGIYQLEWGDLNNAVRSIHLDHLLSHTLRPALNRASVHAGEDLHLLGYCLGGSFAATALKQDIINPRSLTLLAAPLDFHTDHFLWKIVREKLSPLCQLVQQKKRLTRQMLSSFFTQLNPEFTHTKYANYVGHHHDELEDNIFVSVEDWLNGGYDIPSSLALSIFEYYFEDNRLSDFQARKPLCIVSSQKDQLVPYAATVPRNNSQVHLIQPYCGHIGMMAGSRAREEFWTPYLRWLTDHSNIATQ